MDFGLFWQRRSHFDELNKLNNALAESQQLMKETETAVSSKAFEIENLKAKNSSLQKAIKKKSEDVLAIADVAIQYKDLYIKSTNAKQSVVDEAGSQPSSIPSECTECLSKVRQKVEFDETKDNLNIFGYTLTNPAELELNIKWTKPLELQLILARANDGTFRIYLDIEDKQVVPTKLILKIDPSVLEHKWYEKIAFGLDVGASQMGLNGSFRVLYGIKTNLYIGPSVSVSALFMGQVSPFYGASVLWLPFMRN